MLRISIIWVISLLLLPILVITAYAVEVDQKQAENRPIKIGTDKDAYVCGKDEKVIVFISGNPNTTYTLVVTKPDNTAQTYTVTTDASGNATTSIPLSQSEPSGTWTLVLYDANRRPVAEWKFNVKCDQKQPTEPIPVSIKTDKDAYVCDKDKKIVVSISGNPNTTYTLVVTKPDNTAQTYTVTTDASGNATTSIPLSQSEPSGTWLLQLYDKNGRLVAEWKFNVKCDNVPPPPPPPEVPMNPCLTLVSDTSTFVDRGNTVPVNFTWSAPINSNDLGVAGAKPIWSSNGLDTNNPYTFTKYFLLPSGNAYSAILTINADDQWRDLKINGQFVATEPFPGWGNVHTYNVSAYLQPGLNTLEVKAVDIGKTVAALAYKLEVKCKPVQGSTHWDKIIFTIDVKQVPSTPTQPGNEELVKKLRPLIGKTLDIKVRDEPSEIAVLEDTVKAFLAAKYNLTKQDLEYITVKIVEVEYAIDPNVHGKMVPPQEPQKTTEASTSTKGNRMNNDIGDGVYYAMPLMGIAGLGAFLAIRYRKEQKKIS